MSGHPERHLRTGPVLAGVLLVLLAACSPTGAPTGTPTADGRPTAAPDSGSPSPAASSPGPEAPTTPAPTPIALGPPPDLEQEGRFPIVAYQGAELLGAEELDFTQLLGRGVPIALNFWAGECPPCRAEMPAFQRVYRQHSNEFLLVGIDIGSFIALGNRASARSLLNELGITYPAVYAVDARAVADYNVVAMPTTIFYAADGSELMRHNGLMTEDQFAEAVRQLVATGS